MKFLERHHQSSWFKSAIIMEKGDYNLHPGKIKGLPVDYIFIPECDKQYYTEDNPLYQQLLSNIRMEGILFGEIFTYKK